MGKRSRFLEILPNFLLFFLFACCMFFVLMSGAKLYKNVSSVMEEQFSVNTCVSYVTAKLRHYDMKDTISLGKIGENDTLLLREEINGKAYLTYLYCYDGSLMELFCPAEMTVQPADGQTIMPLDTLDFTIENHRVSFSCEVEGEQAEGVVFLQSGEGASV